MTARFEDRHRELREGMPNSGFAETDPMAKARRETLRRFDHRTGPAVDELIADVRLDYQLADDILTADADERVLLANERLEVRYRVRDLLAALDEAAARA